MTDNATPRPWFIERRSVNDVRIVDENPNTTIAVMGNWLPEHLAERDANAALIILAVNSFDGLEAENRKLRAALKEHAPYKEWCSDPLACHSKGSCPRDPNCGD